MAPGVSVVICCHNSAGRLPETLSHLVAQKVRDGIRWEVVVVDNASTDGTSQVALSSWPEDPPASLKVVKEPQKGLVYARVRGFKEAAYEIVSFIDDDNWVCQEWVEVVSEVMGTHSDVGVCGGLNEPVFDVDPPWWFDSLKGSYAIGPQGEAGDVTLNRGYLWGAGLNVRKSAWEQLVESGYRQLLVGGRRGKILSGGEDSEFCFALRLAGWRLWYEPGLKLRHYLPVERLKWSYMRSVYRGAGLYSVGLAPYYSAMAKQRAGFVGWLEKTWQWMVLLELKKLLLHPVRLLLSHVRAYEGNPEVLSVERIKGRLSGLLGKRKAYNLSFRKIRDAAWNKTGTRMD